MGEVRKTRSRSGSKADYHREAGETFLDWLRMKKGSNSKMREWVKAKLDAQEAAYKPRTKVSKKAMKKLVKTKKKTAKKLKKKLDKRIDKMEMKTKLTDSQKEMLAKLKKCKKCTKDFVKLKKECKSKKGNKKTKKCFLKLKK